MTEHYRDAIAKHIQHYEDVSPEPSLDWQLQRVTSMSLADDEAAAKDLAADVEWMRSEDFDAQLIGSEEIYELEPSIRPAWLPLRSSTRVGNSTATPTLLRWQPSAKD